MFRLLTRPVVERARTADVPREGFRSRDLCADVDMPTSPPRSDAGGLDGVADHVGRALEAVGILRHASIAREERDLNRPASRRIGVYALLVALYFASTVPMGLFLYGLKSEVGLDIFKTGGFHNYMLCLSASFPLKERTAGAAGSLNRHSAFLWRRR